MAEVCAGGLSGGAAPGPPPGGVAPPGPRRDFICPKGGGHFGPPPFGHVLPVVQEAPASWWGSRGQSPLERATSA